MADARDPDSPDDSERREAEDPFAPGQAPAPYWAQPGEPIGPPQEQIPPPDIPPHWQQPYGAPPQEGPGWGAPPPQYGDFAGEKPNNYLVWGVVSTLLCCLPLGVASIYYATRVNQRWQAGDVAGAKHAADRARTFAIASAVIGVLALAVLLSTGGFEE
jgi:hypothetical protein